MIILMWKFYAWILITFVVSVSAYIIECKYKNNKKLNILSKIALIISILITVVTFIQIVKTQTTYSVIFEVADLNTGNQVYSVAKYEDKHDNYLLDTSPELINNPEFEKVLKENSEGSTHYDSIQIDIKPVDFNKTNINFKTILNIIYPFKYKMTDLFDIQYTYNKDTNLLVYSGELEKSDNNSDTFTVGGIDIVADNVYNSFIGKDVKVDVAYNIKTDEYVVLQMQEV